MNASQRFCVLTLFQQTNEKNSGDTVSAASLLEDGNFITVKSRCSHNSCEHYNCIEKKSMKKQSGRNSQEEMLQTSRITKFDGFCWLHRTCRYEGGCTKPFNCRTGLTGYCDDHKECNATEDCHNIKSHGAAYTMHCYDGIKKGDNTVFYIVNKKVPKLPEKESSRQLVIPKIREEREEVLSHLLSSG